jgi:hypothetical protein
LADTPFKEMKIEYLIITKNDSSFFTNKNGLIKFLEVDSSIKVSGEDILYSHNGDNCNIKYEIVEAKNDSKNEVSFHLILNFDVSTSEKLIVAFTKTLKRNTLKINQENTVIYVIWDDLGISNAKKAYPLINEVENLMRKLISKFMLINIGMDWIKGNSPADVISKVKSSEIKNNLFYDDLYKTDFIHLSEILFKGYRLINVAEMDQLIKKAAETGAVNIEELKSFIPKSNWERHFQKLINGTNEDEIKQKWEDLYLLRNEIAHNRFLEKSDLLKIEALSDFLRPILKKAIESLDQVKLSSDEKEITINSLTTDPLTYRLSKVAKMYNISIGTITEFLRTKGYTLPNNPMAKISSDLFALIDLQYSSERRFKIIEIL